MDSPWLAQARLAPKPTEPSMVAVPASEESGGVERTGASCCVLNRSRRPGCGSAARTFCATAPAGINVRMVPAVPLLGLGERPG
jgi:hypothetical protein